MKIARLANTRRSLSYVRWASRSLAGRISEFNRPGYTGTIRGISRSAPEAKDSFVRLQLLLLATWNQTDVAGHLQEVVELGPMDEWLSQALLLAAKDCSGTLLYIPFVESGTANKYSQQLMHDLAAMTGTAKVMLTNLRLPSH